MGKGAGVGAAAAALGILSASQAGAVTYVVGPGRPLADLQSVAPLLRPGDRVEVDGGATYPGGLILRESGTREAPITVIGRRAGGRRPILSGGTTTVEIRGDHVVLEGFEITGGSARCLYHHADDLVVRDVLVRDCPRHGVLSADEDSGSLTLAYDEISGCGSGDGAHPVYVATDEEAFPRSVFRMEHCFVHDGRGGNNVKSRAERNEIYANWIEGARYHELELVGPDGADRKHAREDSDVVGNVIRKTGPGWAIRVGGDGSGETLGRYRFVNDTIVLGPAASGAFRLFDGLESIEMDNDVITREGGGPVRVLVEQEVRWAAGRRLVTGLTNWVPQGSTGVPPEWAGTLRGLDPGFVSAEDPRPLSGSPLIGAGTLSPSCPPRFALPLPHLSPAELPPRRALERVGTATHRLRGATDIGAFPFDGPRVPSPLPPAPGKRPRPSATGVAVVSSALSLLALSAAALRRVSRRRLAPRRR